MRASTVLLTLLVLASSRLQGGQAAREPPDARNWYELHAPIADEFRRAFDTRTSFDREAWMRELERFYRTDGKLAYRGVCDEATRTLDDFAHLFVSVSHDLMSKNTVKALREAVHDKREYDLRRGILAEFSRYDRDAYLYSLHEEVNVHQLGPVEGNEAAYARSYGFSVSWSFWMATEFAGSYPGDVSCANSLVLGVYPATHFVDYGNLETVDARFKRRYPDEREVLGVGAADPDSLALVARLEAREGSRPVITELLLRDPMDPSRVFAFDGSLDVLDEEVSAGWGLLQRDRAEADVALKSHGVRPPTPPAIPLDSQLRIPPGRPLRVKRNGAALQPRLPIALDYVLPLFPGTPSPKP